ncbi:MAG: hypothetical protein ABW174_11105, partial [Flavitalea sp.]
LKTILAKRYGNKITLFQNSNNKTDIKQWIDVLDKHETSTPQTSLNIDYDQYAMGEANLAWVDQITEVFSTDGNALQHASLLIGQIFESVKKENYAIGHLKFLINDSIKISLTSPEDTLIPIEFRRSDSARLLINMRVQASPDNVTNLISRAIKQTELQTGCRIVTGHSSAFQPGYPHPEYRM